MVNEALSPSLYPVLDPLTIPEIVSPAMAVTVITLLGQKKRMCSAGPELLFRFGLGRYTVLFSS